MPNICIVWDIQKLPNPLSLTCVGIVFVIGGLFFYRLFSVGLINAMDQISTKQKPVMRKVGAKVGQKVWKVLVVKAVKVVIQLNHPL